MVENIYKVSYGDGFVLSNCYVDCIVGRQMEIIEALGLPIKQEESVKNLLKKAIWEVHENESVFIQDSVNTAVREAKRKKLDKTHDVPFSGVALEDIK